MFTCFYLWFLSGALQVCSAQDTFYFNLKPVDQVVAEGTELTLLCDVSNRRHIQFQWIHNGRPVTNTSRRFQEGSNLKILRVTRQDDVGAFQCIATNVTTGFSLLSGEAKLEIQCKSSYFSVSILYCVGIWLTCSFMDLNIVTDHSFFQVKENKYEIVFIFYRVSK